MNIRAIIMVVIISCLYISTQAQKVDSIFFHLYTDSLKKGTYNYINVDGKLSTGRWQPLTSKELNFQSSYGSFDGNSLFIDTACKEEKIIITAALKTDTSVRRTTNIYIKTYDPGERLKTVEDVMQGENETPSRRRRKNRE